MGNVAGVLVKDVMVKLGQLVAWTQPGCRFSDGPTHMLVLSY